MFPFIFADRKDGKQEERKMGYNPKQAKEGEDATQLPRDSIFDAVITDIKDGQVKNFISADVEWKGDREGRVIDVEYEIKVDEKMVKASQLFTYKEENGCTVYTPKSNLGKYKMKYKKLPEAGDQIKVITNSDGFGKIKLD